jgi:hypothetical protein
VRFIHNTPVAASAAGNGAPSTSSVPSAGAAAPAASASISQPPPAATTRTLVRDPSFAQLTEADVTHFRSIVGEEGIVQDEAALQPYNNDWMNKFRQFIETGTATFSASVRAAFARIRVSQSTLV